MIFLTAATRPPLGADVWVLANVIASLDRQRTAVDVCVSTGTDRDPTPMYRAIRSIPDVRIHRVDLGLGAANGVPRRLRAGWRASLAVARLVAFARRQHTSIVHVADRRVDAVAGVMLARLAGARSVVHCNVAYAPWMPRSLRWALRRADALIAVSDFVARTLVDGGHDRARVHVVPNAIDVAAWNPRRDRAETRHELGLPEGAPAVLSVCRLFEAKGPADLIRACARLRDDHPDLRLLIAGVEGVPGGTYGRELEALVSELGVPDTVTFLGWRDDIARLMAAADVYAMPSHDEPFGLVFVEAMAMELPVVAVDNGGTPEVVEQGTSGLLSAPGDIDGLVANLAKLIADPSLRHAMGAAGRRRVIGRFDRARFGADIAGVYDRVGRGRR